MGNLIRKTIVKFGTVVVLGSLLAAFGTVAFVPTANALSGSEFQAGRIIDDSIFYNPNTMTIQQIQDFLNAKVPVCDTWGTQMRGSVTRAQHGTSNGNPPPYTCLKDFRQNTVAKPAEAGLCNGYGVANHSAADIIYTVAQSCGINPKALLVLLQKEQALITDDWPWAIQYRAATGYGCPDTAECDSQYYGFFNQVYSAARGFKYYAKYPGSFNHVAGRNNNILYSPAAGCGSSTVFIQNQATAGLYNYTPYQPNASALANLYGSGDGCAAYGNRNFWRLFNDWFGSTTDNIPISYNVRLTSPIVLSPTSPVAGEPVTITYTVRNFDPNNPVVLQSSVIQCRLLPNTSCDSAYNPSITLAANEQRTFTQTLTTMQTGGSYRLTPYFLQNGTWYRFGPHTTSGSSVELDVPGMRLITPVTTSPANPVAGEPVTVSYTVQNIGISPVHYQTSVLQCRLNSSINCDPAYGEAMTVNPGERRTFSVTLPGLQGGSYELTPYFQTNNVWYKYGTWEVSSNNLTMAVPDIRLTGNITTSPSDPIPGQTMNISYTVRNFGASPVAYQSSVLQCRVNASVNCDSDYNAPLTLAAGEERTFNATIPTSRAGAYSLTPFFLHNGRWYQYGKGVASSNAVALNVPPYVASLELVGNIVTSPAQPIPGQPITVTYTARNVGTKPAIYQTSILQCRLNTSTNCDPAYDAPLTIAAGDQRTFTVNLPAVRDGSYSLTPYFAQNGDFHRYAKGSAANNSLRLDVPAYVADMRLVGPITIAPANPAPGQTLTISYTAKNHGSQPAIFQSSILQCRRFTVINCDPAYDAPITISAGDQHTFSASIPAMPSGHYIFTPYFMQNNSWHRYGIGAAPANSLEKTF